MTKLNQRLTDTTLRRRINDVTRSSGMRGPEGVTFGAIVDRAVEDRRLTLFVPWAAPRGGSKEAGSILNPEARAMKWLAGVRESLGELVDTRLVVMFADSYADRNGYDSVRVGEYFRTIKDMLAAAGMETTTILASQIEDDPLYRGYLSQEAYGLASLPVSTQQIVVGNAARYRGLEGDEAYEPAADYVARRRAEAQWVVGRLGALTITMNGPNGNAALEGMDTAMAYAPIDVRTPWLRSD